MASSIFAKAQKTLASLRQDVLLLASESANNESALNGQISASMTAMQRHLRDMQEFVRREMDSGFRMAEQFRKLSQLQRELDQIKQQMESINSSSSSRRKAEQRAIEQREREQLILPQPTALNLTSSSTADVHLRIQDSVQRSIQQVDQYIDMSRQSLQKLSEQGISLKSAQRRMLDVANTLGLSQSVIKWIERRTVEDKYVFWVGVVVTLFVMYMAITNLI